MKYNSRQEVFDAVVAHAESMNERSIVGDTCVYRGDNGSKCLVGALIEDQDYDPRMDCDGSEGEGSSVSSLEKRGLLPEYLLEYVDLLTGCQVTHDDIWDHEEENFKPVMIENLKYVALRFNLQYNGVL